MLSSNDLVFIFLSIELQSYGLYLICTIYRSSESATSGGLTYFLLGGLSSCFILLGQSLLYSNTSVTCLDGYYLISSMYEISYNTTNNFFSLENSNYLNISLLIICVGFLFKVSAAPFHFWSPDVYGAIPTLVTTFVAIIAKISILTLIILMVILNPEILLRTTNLISLLILTVKWQVQQFFFFIPFLSLVLLAINLIFAPHNAYQEKNSVFECGCHSFLDQNSKKFSVHFFFFALLFLLFDLCKFLHYLSCVCFYVIYTNG